MLINQVSQLIGRASFPDALEKTFLALNRKGSMSVLPLEASVTVGRSVEAQKRSGFLELQERLLEELAVAVVWLWGVSGMSKLYKALIRRFFPQYRHLDLDTKFRTLKKANGLFLNGGEIAARNATEAKILNRLRLGKLAFSVGIATVLAGVVIPKLNIKKTQWIDHFLENKIRNKQQQGEQRKKAQPTLPLRQAPQPAHNLPSAGATSTGPQAPQPLSANRTGITSTTYSGLPPSPSTLRPVLPNNPSSSYLQQNPLAPRFDGAITSQPKFGFAGSGLLNQAAELAGHAIEQTDFGHLLAVDAVLTGGRIKEYGERNKYEGIEIGFRDAASVYFYMFCMPHVMKLTSKVLDPLFKTNLMLEPKVAEAVQAEFLRGLLEVGPEYAAHISQISEPLLTALQLGDTKAVGEMLKSAELVAKLNDIRIKPQDLRKMISGGMAQLEALQGPLTKALYQAEGKRFIELFTQEATAYKAAGTTSTPGQLPSCVKAIQQYLEQRFPNQSHYSSQDIQSLIEAIQSKHSTFESLNLNSNQQQDLITALKQAFRHSTGLTIENLRAADPKTLLAELMTRHPELASTIAQLPEETKILLSTRLQQAARVDGLDSAASMMVRTNNLIRPALRQTLPAEQAYLWQEQSDRLAGWVEKAAVKRMDLDALLRQELNILGQELHRLSEKGRIALPADIRQQLNHLHEQPAEKLAIQLTRISEALTQRKGKRWAKLLDSLLNHTGLANRVDDLSFLLNPAKALRDSGLTAQADQLERLIILNRPENAQLLGNTAQENLKAWMALTQTQISGHLDVAEAPLLKRYLNETPALLDGAKGRLFSVLFPDAETQLSEKVKEILSGGIQYDSALLARGLETEGKLALRSHLFSSPKTTEEMRQGINNWCQKLLAFRRWDQATEAIPLGKVLESTRLFKNLSQTSRYGSFAIAMITAALGLGVLVPKLQSALTKKLTGKKEHPGLAAMRHHVGGDSSHVHQPEQPTQQGLSLQGQPQSAQPSAFPRNFQVFQHARQQVQNAH